MEIPPGKLAMGVPAKVRRPVSAAERERFRQTPLRYVGYREHYKEEEGI
jgi:carbonic anhydrase/acetyltransferase-like protein (isoleucine patch superfamily)